MNLKRYVEMVSFATDFAGIIKKLLQNSEKISDFRETDLERLVKSKERKFNAERKY